MLEHEIVQRFGPGHFVLICEEKDGVEYYRFGRVVIIPMTPLKGNDIWEVPLIVYLPHELPPIVDKYEFKYDDNGDWDGDYTFYAVEIPDCVKESQRDKLDILLALEDSYKYSLPMETLTKLLEQEGLVKELLKRKSGFRDCVYTKRLLPYNGNEIYECVSIYGVVVGEDGIVLLLREDKYTGEFDKEDNEPFTDVSLTCDGYVYPFPIEFSGEFDENNQRWVINTTKEPLRLLTDKERDKLFAKSSYFGDGYELTYTDK